MIYKPHFFSFTLILLVISFIGCDNSSQYPSPTDTDTHIPDLMFEEEEDPNHGMKEQWIEAIHKAAPDVDWRSLDYKARLAKSISYQSLKTRSNGLEFFANGKIIGSWNEKGSNNQSGRIMITAYDTISSNLYCITAGGSLYQGDLNGNNWTPLNEQIRFSSATGLQLLRDTNGLRILVGTSKGVLYSDDIGVTWEEATGLSNVLNWGSIQKVLGVNENSPYVYALVREWNYNTWNEVVRLFRSDDKGESFTRISQANTNNTGSYTTHDIWINHEIDSICFYLRSADLLTFNHNSDTIDTIGTNIHSGTSTALLTGQFINDELSLYVYSDQEIYSLTDTSQTWQYQGNVGNNPFRRFSFSASFQTQNMLYFGAVNTFTSSDAGATWNLVNQWYDYYGDVGNKLHADIPAIQSHLNSGKTEFQLISTDGGLYISNDNIATVQNISLEGLNCSQYYSTYTDRNDTNNIYAGAQDQGFQRASVDNGSILDFEQTVSGDYAHLTSSNEGTSLWFLYPGFVAYNENAKTGIWDATYNFNGLNNFWLPPMQAVPNSPNKTWLCGVNTSTSDPTIYEFTYTNGNINANTLSFDFTTLTTGNLSAISFSPINSNYCFVLTDNGEILKTTDGGNTFTKGTFTAGPSPHYFYGNSIFASKSDLGTIYIGGSGYSNSGVWVSHDTGNTFVDLANNIPSTLFYDLDGDANDSLVFAATELGPYAYVISDDQWYSIQGSSPDQVYWSVEYLDAFDKVRFGSHGRGIWDLDLVDTAGISDTTGIYPTFASSHFKAYPNPVIDELNLAFDGVQGDIQIQLYNMSGDIVVDRSYNESDLLNINIGNLATGSYIIRIKTNAFEDQKRIIKVLK